MVTGLQYSIDFNVVDMLLIDFNVEDTKIDIDVFNMHT